MKDEKFIFLSEPYKSYAYRQMDSSAKQYCKVPEIISFITDSISNSTLKKGNKYNVDNFLKYKYNFISGSNKRSVSVIIDSNDSLLYQEEINILNGQLNHLGSIKKYNIMTIKQLLDKPLALMTFTNTVSINQQNRMVA